MNDNKGKEISMLSLKKKGVKSHGQTKIRRNVLVLFDLHLSTVRNLKCLRQKEED